MREDLGADTSNEHKALSPVEQLAMLAMQRGTFETIRDAEDASEDEDDAASAARKSGNVVTHLGFNLHAAVTITAHDDIPTWGASDCAATERVRLSRLPS